MVSLALMIAIMEAAFHVHAGKIMADAAADAGVKVFVFSSLDDLQKRSEAIHPLTLCMCISALLERLLQTLASLG